MIRRTMHEWGSLPIGSGPEEFPEAAVSRVLATARTAQKRLRVGLGDGEAVLYERNGRLRARQVVGVLSAPGVSLEILPKIDGLDDGATRRNLVQMLARTIGLKIADGDISELELQRFDLLEVLIKVFCAKVFAAIHRGLPRCYVPFSADLRTLRGRLDVNRQFTTLAASPHFVASQFEELSEDIALNRIIKAAIEQLRGIARTRENQRRLAELTFVFSGVASLRVSELQFDRVSFDRTNSHWRALYRLARLLLVSRFQSTSSGDAPGYSLLFDMNELFEEFIARVLQRALRGSELAITVQGPRSFALREVETDIGRFATKPDIVINRAERPIMIIDTKWKALQRVEDDPKRGVQQADIYQMMAYGQIYDVARLVLLFPHHRQLGTAAGIQGENVISGRLQCFLAVVTVDLAKIGSVATQLLGIVQAA